MPEPRGTASDILFYVDRSPLETFDFVRFRVWKTFLTSFLFLSRKNRSKSRRAVAEWYEFDLGIFGSEFAPGPLRHKILTVSFSSWRHLVCEGRKSDVNTIPQHNHLQPSNRNLPKTPQPSNRNLSKESSQSPRDVNR